MLIPMSLLVTSSHRHAKHLPRSAPIAAGGTATGARWSPARATASRSACSAARESTSPNPSAWAAASPAIRPESAAASRDSAPTTSPAAATCSGVSVIAKWPRASS